MNHKTNHPENLDIYLDREASDPAYEEIRNHVEACSRCREKVHDWQAFDDLFRGDESRVEIPPFQWHRIAAHLQTPEPAGALAGWRSWFRPRGLAWKMALASVAMAGIILTGLESRKGIEDRQLLLEVARYASEEGPRIASEGNPFRSATGAENNPFALYKLNAEQKSSPGRR